ncbi:gamma-glutamyltransferase family protein [Kineosporia sp. A_224]|uniref:gamma-glutamyltransferase family protein n=1 Tax=Kineosporia sp. A_224 TaxID=1962180 RepID=UPI001E293395|nr:gamma-glutamyltransferase [Kineosporia sp. A_224]
MSTPERPSLPTTRPELAGDLGMVASTHWLASQVGMSVLERGGNAADAAVAAGFVLQVVEPHLNGPGGEVPILVATPDGTAESICGQGTAPAAATPEVFAGLGLDAVPGTGLLAATVPGAFGAWTVLLERHGTWGLRAVLEPAIGYARDGAPVLPRVAEIVAAMAGVFTDDWPTSAALYLPGGRAPEPWARLRMTVLADVYERVLAEAEAAGADRAAQLAAARDAWYRGFVAEAVDDFAATTAWKDSSGRVHGGLLRADDLAGWQPGVEEPARFACGPGDAVEVLKPGLWSQGPVHLQQLALLRALGADEDPLDLDDPQWVHTLTEVAKLAFADREAWYGDGAGPEDAAGGPRATALLADLLSHAYNAGRAALVSRATADPRLRPGAPGGRTPVLPPLADFDTGGVPRHPDGPPGAPDAVAGADDDLDGLALPRAAAPGEGEPTVSAAQRRAGRGDTCHLDVVDARGLMVSATPSGAWLMSSPVVPALGFPLGTRAQMFRLAPGLPSSLRPGARPRTTLTPSLALRDGRPWLAYGTPGGDQQDQWSLLLLLRVLAGLRRGDGLALQAAIDAPMLHSDHMPSSFAPRRAVPNRLVVEDRWPAAVLHDLAARGHDVETVDGWSLGRLSAVADDRPWGGWLRAAANARGAQGYAVGR